MIINVLHRNAFSLLQKKKKHNAPSIWIFELAAPSATFSAFKCNAYSEDASYVVFSPNGRSRLVPVYTQQRHLNIWAACRPLSNTRGRNWVTIAAPPHIAGQYLLFKGWSGNKNPKRPICICIFKQLVNTFVLTKRKFSSSDIVKLYLLLCSPCTIRRWNFTWGCLNERIWEEILLRVHKSPVWAGHSFMQCQILNLAHYSNILAKIFA